MIRLARVEDAEEIAAIYAPIVRETHISFEQDPQDGAAMARRIEKSLAGHYPWLVWDAGGRIAGYAYGSRHRERAAYRWSVETTVYVHPDFRKQGVARSLYRALLAILAAQGYRNAYAGIALPNPASIALHRAAGFQHIGVFERIGYKLGAWRDVSWWQRSLGNDDAPGEIRSLAEVREGPAGRATLMQS